MAISASVGSALDWLPGRVTAALFLAGTSTLSIFGYENGLPVIITWNVP